ncbi:MAG TPA: hypothetical protein VGP94_11450, partial [Tepidisphaeraceae bacterium]|nr:hypothetical protein [Tepidisphaeraceae bacterium]
MSRASWIFIFSILFILIGALHAGEGWLSFFSLLIVDGGLAVLWIACASMLGLSILKFAPLAIPGSLRFATSAALGLGIYSLAALGLGLCGLLHRNTALALPIISVAAFAATHVSMARNLSFSLLIQRAENWLNARATTWWVWIAPVSVLAAATVAAALPPVAMWLKSGDPHPYDVLEYHLQVPREWQETGQITPLKHNVYCFFPANVEMQYLLLMHIAGNAWKVMYTAQFLTIGYGVLSVIAIHAAARALLPGSLLAVLAAAASATIPWLTMLSSVAYNEVGMILYITLAIAWIVVGLQNSSHRVLSFAIAGAMTGFACGAKYTAVPIAAVLFLLILFFPRRVFHCDLSAGALLTGCAVFALTTALTFSPWLLRNWRWAGNPVFPEAMSVFGRGHFTAEQQTRWERAHSPTAEQRPMTKRLSAFAAEVLGDKRYAYILLPAVLIALFTTRWTPTGAIAAATLAALTIFWIGFTHLQSRFFILAVPLAAIILAQAPRDQIARLIQTLLLVMVIAAGCLLTHVILYEELERIPDFRRVIGHQELSDFLTRLVRDRVQAKSNLALVGDARAFLYTLPSSHLHYRTIFDVADLDPTATQKIIDAWLGPEAARLRKECTNIVDQDEL